MNRIRNRLEYEKLCGFDGIALPREQSPSFATPIAVTSTATPTQPLPIDNDVQALLSADNLHDILHTLGKCTRCKLCDNRNNIVFGVGNEHADIMFIGEGPGHNEDMEGIPFVGRAGQLLTRIITAMGLTRDDVYISNIVKCRPPNNRNPEPDEVSACIAFLLQQVRLIEPKVIVCLGSVAIQNLLQTDRKISMLRGKWQKWQGFDVLPTYHPAFLLRNPKMKKPVWEDMKLVMQKLGLEIPSQ